MENMTKRMARPQLSLPKMSLHKKVSKTSNDYGNFKAQQGQIR